MAKQYGLILGKEKEKLVTRPSIFNDDSDSDEAAEKPTGFTKSFKKQDKQTQNKAIEEDPTVYQYDEIYDEMDKKRKESKLSRKDLDRKPKYINRLLAAADRRKKENERRIERQVQRERETEGDEFRDKDAFVTSAYKKKLEEMREMEEEEKREEYLETIGDVKKQGNLDGFYRHLYDQKVNYEENSKENETKPEENETKLEKNNEDKNKTNTRKYRKHKDIDESDHEEEIELKKEHLPSNLDADSDFSIDSSDSEDEKEEKISEDNKKPDTSENTEKPLDLPESNEINVSTDVSEEPEPKKPKIDIWKKRNVGEVFDAALRRYYERKALREL